MLKVNISNAERFPEAWKIWIACVRKWKIRKQTKYPEGWKYGIPDPDDLNNYLYAGCPGKLFWEFLMFLRRM